MNKEERSVLAAVKKFLGSYAKGDVNGCMSTLAASKPFLMLGTNDNEVFKTTAAVRTSLARDFKSMKGIRLGKFHSLHVEAAGTLAFALVETPISYLNEGKKVKTLFRYALSLGKEGREWKIRSGMASVPFASGTYKF